MSFKDQTAIVKIRAMYGKMLKEKEYLNILNCKNISELFNYLITYTEYKNCLKNLNQKNLDKKTMEQLIEKQSIQNCYKIYKYSNKNKILSLMLEELELNEVLKILLSKNSNNSEEYRSLFPKHFNINIKFSKLLECNTEDEFLNCLKNTHYFEIYKKVAYHQQAAIDYSEYEYKLYENLFIKLLQTVKSKTKNIELFELNKIIKTIIDQINLNQIYRHKFLFHLNNNQIKKRILPFHKKLNKKTLKSLLECQKKEEFEERLKLMYSKDLNNSKVKTFKVENLEINALRQKQRICAQYLHLSLNLTTVFYCFFTLQKIEILNLKKIIESKYYDISTQEIKNLLVM